MIRKFYSMRDDAAAVYLDPNLSPTDDVAIRNFDYACQVNEIMSFRPEDFSLWCVGEFDDELGRIQYFEPQKIKQGQKKVKK